MHMPWLEQGRSRRSGAARRKQAMRAQGRAVQKLLTAFTELDAHRGCKTSDLGSALKEVLQAAQAGRQDRQAAQQPQNQDASAMEEPKKTQFCRHYLRGRCSLGAVCRFAHVRSDLGKPQVARMTEAPAESSDGFTNLRAEATAFVPAAGASQSPSASSQAPCQGLELTKIAHSPTSLDEDCPIEDSSGTDGEAEGGTSLLAKPRPPTPPTKHSRYRRKEWIHKVAAGTSTLLLPVRPAGRRTPLLPAPWKLTLPAGTNTMLP